VTNILNIESTTPPTTSALLEHEQHPSTSEAAMLENTTRTTQTQNNDTLVKELPLPLALQQHPNVDPKIVKRTTSERRLSFHLRKKMPKSFSVARNWDQKGNYNDAGKKGKLLKTDNDSMWMKTKGKLKNDDSVWMKTIILGGKSVPDEGKAKKISAYHPRKASVSLSRQCSFINPGAFSVPQSHEEIINKMCEDKQMKIYNSI